MWIDAALPTGSNADSQPERQSELSRRVDMPIHSASYPGGDETFIHSDRPADLRQRHSLSYPQLPDTAHLLKIARPLETECSWSLNAAVLLEDSPACLRLLAQLPLTAWIVLVGHALKDGTWTGHTCRLIYRMAPSQHVDDTPV
jgi:hypothetical protein